MAALDFLAANSVESSLRPFVCQCLLSHFYKLHTELCREGSKDYSVPNVQEDGFSQQVGQ